MHISKVIDNVMRELRELLQYKFNKDLLEWGVKREICENIEKEGYNTYGDCMDFELIKEVKYVFLEKKIIIINKIPIKMK